MHSASNILYLFIRTSFHLSQLHIMGYFLIDLFIIYHSEVMVSISYACIKKFMNFYFICRSAELLI